METNKDRDYLQRCFQLALQGAGNVAPNPMVGAVLVYNDVIIGEGYHQKYGEAHAEVNCINKALEHHAELIGKATLYVSLEPCSHYGKTPPCADLIIRHKIPKVVIGCRDSFAAVNGKGVERLQNAGITVVEHVLEKEAIELNKRFFTFHRLKRPYIILKWAQTRNQIIASGTDTRLMITSEITNRLVHRWRTEESAIMVGAGTAMKDDPLLDNRNWYGRPPLKIVVSASGKLPEGLRMFQSGADTFIFNTRKEEEQNGKRFLRVSAAQFLEDMLNRLYRLQVQSILVEGGQRLLQSFIDAGLWDEARVITNTVMLAHGGLEAPKLHRHQLIKVQHLVTDEIAVYKNDKNQLINSDGESALLSND
ncbi:riboflavin biosynthesis protein RibD [Niabella ginsenosidivorans]|uniref:Riboflavin biosynthesis protein RibD n=1 Tax=Niabella ginsenosidivorans TaxID=1176587 RepID=A0A1A9I0R2_9BACT|nr:bifunctional diaminohydroxyphosphoribosylaminopyrimidine deaminase/5-amino-6-(5-phosphoribosylamino)uracil reductase RibD [Niabella ginsenosidivorans]ANH81247.1 riboflavin biosynthesis protein RibD [Niabella ginsenosidivorans]